jgi:hypothetical protein
MCAGVARATSSRVFWRTQTGVGSLRGMAGVGWYHLPDCFFQRSTGPTARLPTNRLKCIRQSGQSASKWAVGTFPTADCKSSPVGSRQSGKCAVFPDYRLGGGAVSASHPVMHCITYFDVFEILILPLPDPLPTP